MTRSVNTHVRWLRAVTIGVVLGLVATPILVTEASLHIAYRPKADPGEAKAVVAGSGASWETARVRAADGVMLDGYLFTPREGNGAAVILLHGVGDTRSGMMTHASYLVRAGFTVLTPDSRGHGASGGGLITYGIREADDVHVWVEELLRARPGMRVYGLGQSMGAAILLQSLRREARFRAVVADCPFDSFEDVAEYRLRHASHLGSWAAWPVMQTGMLYTRLVYGVDLLRASASEAIRDTEVPILLIHGMKDVNIPPAESGALHAVNPRATTLWLVPGAGHVASVSVNPREYIRRVTEWFETHR